MSILSLTIATDHSVLALRSSSIIYWCIFYDKSKSFFHQCAHRFVLLKKKHEYFSFSCDTLQSLLSEFAKQLYIISHSLCFSLVYTCLQFSARLPVLHTCLSPPPPLLRLLLLQLQWHDNVYAPHPLPTDARVYTWPILEPPPQYRSFRVKSAAGFRVYPCKQNKENE